MSTSLPRAEDVLSRLEQTRGAPLRAMIEISDRCNEVCVHCYQVQGQKGEMTTEQVKRVLDDLAQMGVLLLTISGGEPTLRKDFLEILEHARNLRFMLRLFTNGITMTPELADELQRLAVFCVEISLYSHRAEVHDFVTGVPGSFERTVRAIRELRARGVGVVAKTPVMSVNEGELGAYAAFVAELGAECRMDPGALLPREGGDRAPTAMDAGPQAFFEAAKIAAHPVTGPRPARRAPTDTLCGAGDLVHIEPNGEIRPCTMLDLNLGHALQDGVARARAENDALREIRGLSWQHVHGCRECDLQSYCHRCYASALGEVGDALAPYPSACRGAAQVVAQQQGSAAHFIAAEGLDVGVGPYRQVAPGVYQPFEDAVSAEDDALAAQLTWIRRASGGLPTPKLAIRPGELVQIRRPGRKTSKLERVPAGDDDPRGAAREGVALRTPSEQSVEAFRSMEELA